MEETVNWRRREPGRLLKDGARGSNDISHVLLDTWRIINGDGRDDLQIDCLRIKVDVLIVRGPK
jgi:hypothetical protein